MTNLPTRTATLTTYETEEDVRRALKAGAKGYLLKEPVPQQIRMPCGESLKDRLCFQQR
jgi:DNA-binding NarL/FixJ family response regulator